MIAGRNLFAGLVRCESDSELNCRAVDDCKSRTRKKTVGAPAIAIQTMVTHTDLYSLPPNPVMGYRRIHTVTQSCRAPPLTWRPNAVADPICMQVDRMQSDFIFLRIMLRQ